MSQHTTELLKKSVEKHNAMQQIASQTQRIADIDAEMKTMIAEMPESLTSAFAYLVAAVIGFIGSRDPMKPITEKNVQFFPATKKAISAYNEEVKKYEQSLADRNDKIAGYLLNHQDLVVKSIGDHIREHGQKSSNVITNLGQLEHLHVFTIDDSKTYYSVVSANNTWVEIRDGKYFGVYNDPKDNKITIQVFEAGEGDKDDINLNLTVPEIETYLQ